MSFKTFSKVCFEIEELNSLLGTTYEIFLTGGEPFLHNELAKFIRTAKTNARCRSVAVFTNGTLPTSNVKPLIDSGLDALQVSLEGEKKYHDTLRGDGNWDRSVNFIKDITSVNALPVGVATTITSKNYFSVSSIYNFCSSIGARSLLFHRYIPCGSSFDKELSLSANDNTIFYNELKNAMNSYESTQLILNNCSIASFQATLQEGVFAFDDKISGGCHIGVSCLHIEPNGDLITCPKASITIGNINQSSLTELFFFSDLLKKFRKRNFGTICTNCLLKNVCGGCRAIALHYGGDVFGDETLCPYYIKAQDAANTTN